MKQYTDFYFSEEVDAMLVWSPWTAVSYVADVRTFYNTGLHIKRSGN